MSLQTWNEEFYPITASEAAQEGVKAAVEHSLRKWEGLRKENLDKHGLMTDPYDHTRILNVKSKRYVFGVWGDSCALCMYAEDLKVTRVYNDEDYDDDLHDYPDCIGCPLDEIDNCNRGGSKYGVFRRTGNPEPMIENLKQCLINITK